MAPWIDAQVLVVAVMRFDLFARLQREPDRDRAGVHVGRPARLERHDAFRLEALMTLMKELCYYWFGMARWPLGVLDDSARPA